MGKEELSEGLQRALGRGELSLHYQPQVTQQQEVIGLEALLRWTSPTFGCIPPADFIPIAEETGLIIPIGTWVLRESCRQHRQWQTMGHVPIRAAVNVSVFQFAQPDFVAVVGQALQDSGLDSELLELELTESLFIHDIDIAVSKLTQLRDMGVKIAIDDFGTGYSCLAYLHRLPLDTLKIPRAFVRELDATSPDSDASVSRTAVVRAIISLARELQIHVLAEGVETELQRRYLERFGCERMQGFLFARPCPAGETERMLASMTAQEQRTTPWALSA